MDMHDADSGDNKQDEEEERDELDLAHQDLNEASDKDTHERRQALRHCMHLKF